MEIKVKKNGFVPEIVFFRTQKFKTRLIIKAILCFGLSFLIDCFYLSLDSLPQRYATIISYHQISQVDIFILFFVFIINIVSFFFIFDKSGNDRR